MKHPVSVRRLPRASARPPTPSGRLESRYGHLWLRARRRRRRRLLHLSLPFLEPDERYMNSDGPRPVGCLAPDYPVFFPTLITTPSPSGTNIRSNGFKRAVLQICTTSSSRRWPQRSSPTASKDQRFFEAFEQRCSEIDEV